MNRYIRVPHFVTSGALAIALSVTAVPVTAHHVPVTAAVSDADAAMSFATEYAAQRVAVMEAVRAFYAAPSASEKSQALLDVENVLTVTIEHIGGLNVRSCFAHVHELALGEFVLAADGFALLRQDKGEEAALVLMAANAQRALVVEASGIVDCVKVSPVARLVA